MMQPQAYPIQSELLEQAWQSFMETGQLQADIQSTLDPIIHHSWQRCAPRLDPRARPRLAVLEGEALERILNRYAYLLTIARPVMEDIHQFAERSGVAVLLANGAACILEILGDRPMVKALNHLGMQPGAYLDEGRMGTNALALALLQAVPVQVVGAEHYFEFHRDLTCSAAPIHDVSGRIIGALAMAGRSDTAHSHTLTAVMAAARAIGNQLHAESYLQEANRRLTELQGVFSAISEGVMSWNQEGKVTHMNALAAEILRLKPQAVTGRHLGEVLQLPSIIAEAVQLGESLRDVEASFGVNDHAVDCLVSLQPTYEGLRGPVGYIATLRPIERVHRLVHRLVGAQATLTLDDVQGESAAMRRVRRQARIAARGTAPVLLQGEDGVGKNPLARAIHNAGARANHPFIAINCLALPHELMLSEFLGYEGGAFSGALAEGRPSKFELTSGGTLFLDEIEGLTLEMQAALLQVIETGHVMRLGGTRPIPVDVRVIAATSVDLEARVAEGSFRSDLYYRFGVFIIDLPPLRERVEDIPLLVERFLARITQQMDCPAFITDEALETLSRYPWPGNIRELENVLERAVAASKDGLIRVPDLPALVRDGRALVPGTLHPQPVHSLAEAEREAIIRAGWACQGQVSVMANHLGISRTTLWRKMKSWNIDPQDFKR
jgi:transcriptional regulator of acetoin/glycerol metabolism